MTLVHFLQATPAAFLVSVALLGLAVGSFLNVVIYRLPVVMHREWRQQCAELLGEQEPAGQDAHPERFNLVVPRSR